MTDRELMQQALEALEFFWNAGYRNIAEQQKTLITALRDRLAQPEQEFIKHHGDNEGWSEWVCPDPDDYLISCCDCGLVHQAQFRVAKYAPAPSEECEIVNDPDLQAQFRMRRHAVTKPQPDNWTPEDTAHRAGGLAQPEQGPVAWGCNRYIEDDNGFQIGTDEPELAWGKYAPDDNGWWPLYTALQPAQPLTNEQIWQAARYAHIAFCLNKHQTYDHALTRAIEAAHGIGEKPDAA